ncbi:MAG: zinc-ribbon domain-containing protein [Acidobacteriota bacterium]
MESQSIYCPRCGTSNPQKVRFCRQCGLAMAPVTGYLSGEVPPVPIQPGHHSLKPHARILASFTPRQKMILSIILAAISPAVLAILDLDELSPLAAILMPFAISFAVFYFRNQEKQLRSGLPVHQVAPPSSLPVSPPNVPVYVPPAPSSVAVSDTSNDTDRQLQLPPESLNGQIPLSMAPGSVTEEETRRLG